MPALVGSAGAPAKVHSLPDQSQVWRVVVHGLELDSAVVFHVGDDVRPGHVRDPVQAVDAELVLDFADSRHRLRRAHAAALRRLFCSIRISCRSASG